MTRTLESRCILLFLHFHLFTLALIPKEWYPFGRLFDGGAHGICFMSPLILELHRRLTGSHGSRAAAEWRKDTG